jgi:hypothetical protein
MALRSCPGCGKRIPDWARDNCPSCGETIRKKKNSLMPLIAVAGIVLIIIAVIAALFLLPQAPTPPPPPVTPVPTPTIPQPPVGNIAITAVRQGAGTIALTFIGGTAASDVANFTVNLNGAIQPTRLSGTVGTSMSVKSGGSAGSDHIVVVAFYKNGAQKVVLDKAV